MWYVSHFLSSATCIYSTQQVTERNIQFNFTSKFVRESEKTTVLLHPFETWARDSPLFLVSLGIRRSKPIFHKIQTE